MDLKIGNAGRWILLPENVFDSVPRSGSDAGQPRILSCLRCSGEVTWGPDPVTSLPVVGKACEWTRRPRDLRFATEAKGMLALLKCILHLVYLVFKTRFTGLRITQYTFNTLHRKTLLHYELAVPISLLWNRALDDSLGCEA